MSGETNFITTETSRDFLLAEAMIIYPALAKALPSSNPIPVEAPVIQTTFCDINFIC
jgi:hypothetical protein